MKRPDYRFCQGSVTVYCAQVKPTGITVRRRVLPRAWLDTGRRFGNEGRGSTRLVGAVAENEFLLIVPLGEDGRALGGAKPGGEAATGTPDSWDNGAAMAADEAPGRDGSGENEAASPPPAWADPASFWAMEEGAAGGCFTLNRGDRVLAGLGPCVASADAWTNFVPAAVPGLCVVGFVKPQRGMDGTILHVEAGP